MYIDTSSDKKINFTAFAMLLVACLLITLSFKSVVFTTYRGVGATARHVALSVSGVKDNFLYRIFGKDSQLAFAGRGLLPVVSEAGPGDAVASDVPVFVYHGIVENADRFSTTAEIFADQMYALKRAGYYTISLDDFEQFMNGTKKLKDKAFLLTFDDGRTDSFKGADPILKALGFRAVMFVATADSINRQNMYYLGETELKGMIDSGRWEIGSHAVQENTKAGLVQIDEKGTFDNFLSNKIWLTEVNRLETDEEYKNRVTKELVASKEDLERAFGTEVSVLSYPFGDYGQQSLNNPEATSVINQIVRDNYSLAFQQTWPRQNTNISNYKQMDHYHLLRIESGTTWTGEYVVELLNTAAAKPLPYHDTFSIDHGWRGTWGLKSISDNTLTLQSGTTTSGAFTFLDGTLGWKNYFYRIQASLKNGSYLSLISRFIDSDNNVACVFGGDAVRIEEKINGVTEVVVHVKNVVKTPLSSTVEFGMLVDGDGIKCYEGLRVVAYSRLTTNKLSHGGIALQVWNKTIGKAYLSLRSLDVVSSKEASSLIKTMPKYDLR